MAFGELGESKIAHWLRNRGNYVLPVYEKEIDNGKGPRVYAPDRRIIAPDLFVWGPRGVKWIEAKHKSVFSWHRATSRWVTGIDIRHYEEYLSLAKEWRPWPIWLLFLHSSSEPWEEDAKHDSCPSECPTGLFGEELLKLESKESHRSDKHGSSGMVYWAHSSLVKLATLEEAYGND